MTSSKSSCVSGKGEWGGEERGGEEMGGEEKGGEETALCDHDKPAER